LTGEARLGFAWRGLIATNASPGYMLFVAPDFCRTEVIVLGVIIHVLFVAAR
jgi:taurine transport system permease protein